eukprot:COSAG03_NODE_1472_length_4020_cov_4.885998_6_plen_71_part_00
MQSYADDYHQCYAAHGCESLWTVFCERKVSEWASQCEDELILRLKCEGHQVGPPPSSPSLLQWLSVTLTL